MNLTSRLRKGAVITGLVAIIGGTVLGACAPMQPYQFEAGDRVQVINGNLAYAPFSEGNRYDPPGEGKTIGEYAQVPDGATCMVTDRMPYAGEGNEFERWYKLDCREEVPEIDLAGLCFHPIKGSIKPSNCGEEPVGYAPEDNLRPIQK
ncbi:hypothetical protein QT06_C0001G1077 [archaeon GW2011_AR15]|nr:hypothetical protein QT06_C0001G1077 [archaeon GW2011_AR15]